ncbi:MAG: peroxidase-related enzyme [Pseudomonadota bacterium]
MSEDQSTLEPTLPGTSGREPTALDLPMDEPLDEDIGAVFAKCVEKLGLVPNVLKAYAFDQTKLRAFMAFYNDLMLGPSGLTKLEREMIAVVVSSANRCFYCLTAHGQAVRLFSDDPILGEILVMNYRAADLSERHRAMLDFAWALTTEPHVVDDAHRAGLRAVGFSDRDIWDIASVVGFFNMTNRLATATDMRPNPEYHAQNR